ncbi:hypothetical protein DB345_15775 [Spartobacteria bacterium LR76]|nr:hypothetical protein DB345_15775 [Spartobacteria bacterium LR76]
MLAVIFHFGPMVGQQISDTALAASRQSEPRAAAAVPTPSQADFPPSQPAQAPAVSISDRQQLKDLNDEAASKLRVGEYDAALKILDEAEAIVPGDPAVLWLKAKAFEGSDQPGEALAALEAASRYPDLPPQVRANIQKDMNRLSQLVDAVPGARKRTAQPSALESGGEQELRENGLQPGSSLGIVDIRLRDVKPGIKGLKVAVKARPGSTINVKDVKLLAFFYEQTEDGEVQLTESKVVPQWLSPPIDWAGNDFELLELQYTTPDASGDASGRKYFGYVVGIYYNNELQDFRADPGKLAKDFPLPLYLKQGNE